MTTQETELNILRNQIDKIDTKLHQLLNQRADCALKVGKVKQKYQDRSPPVFYRPEREAQVLRKVMERNKGPLADADIARLFREIMSLCLALEEPLRVAFSGVEGSFTQQAASKHFGHAAFYVPLKSLKNVFREVQLGTAQYGVVPIEHASNRSVSHIMELFKQYDLKICGEVEIPEQLQLLINPDDKADNIEHIYCCYQTQIQCHNWLEIHYPEAEIIEVTSNSEAVRQAQTNGSKHAAITTDMAAMFCQLETAIKNIQDEDEYMNRFLIIGNQDTEPSGDDKTSILASVNNIPGALFKLLQPFHQNEVSLTRVETHTTKQNSLFYIDFEGHQADSIVQNTFDILKQQSIELKVLGSYPRAVL